MNKLLSYFKTQLFFQELAIFSIAQFLGVFIIKRIGSFLEISSTSSGQVTALDFVFYFFIGTVVMIVLSNRSKISGLLMNLFFIFTLFLGSNLFLSLFIDSSAALYFSIALIIVRFVFPSIFLHNLLFLLSIVTFSSALALELSSTVIVILLALFAVYDIVSVYWTKHMVKMAKAMIERHLIFGFIIPEKIKYNFWNVKEAHAGKDAGVVFLGGGDIGLPLFLVANASFGSLAQGVVVAIFSILGMVLSYYLFVSQKLRKPMPALPPISMMTIIGYFLAQLLF